MSRGRRISRVKLIPPSPEALKLLLEWDNSTLFHSPGSYPLLTCLNLFGERSSMQLEIGCGTGEFLISLAKEQPQSFFVGVDLSRRVTYHAVNQAFDQSIENIRIIKADIRLLYPLMPPAIWERVYLNYPDPNYAKSQLKHRLFTPEFLDVMHHTLIPEGCISIVTDQHPFLLDMLAIAEADPRFRKTHSEAYLTTFKPVKKTRFQKAWERLQRPVFRFELAKIS